MRILILEDDPIDAMAIQRELPAEHELSITTTMREALAELASSPAFDAIVTDLNLPDSKGVDTLAKLKTVAPGVPVIVTTGHISSGLRERVEAFGAPMLVDKTDGYAILDPMLHQIDLLHRTVAAHRAEIMVEVDKMAEEVAQKVADEAIQQMVQRLGMSDEEGMRMAIRLARGWDATKAKFIQALATGIAGALLLALGSGILAVLRNHGSK